jgi:hypothetical protein
VWEHSRCNPDDDVALFGTQDDRIGLPITSNVSNGCGFDVPLGRWVRLKKLVYRNLLGYLSACGHNQNGSDKENPVEFHINTLPRRSSQFLLLTGDFTH